MAEVSTPLWGIPRLDHSQGGPNWAGSGLFRKAFGQTSSLGEAQGFFPSATPGAAIPSITQPPAQAVGTLGVTRRSTSTADIFQPDFARRP